ncbi:hypothetical protein A2619_02335 [candidate division WWE3 bacterium RIFOXYD1_FULL_39_9]|uniref:DUF2493 domain-containing protein n=1 Tax=candidate division WWE3 bacterium RIFOXYD1_FULL_39_9 TaxID=1802649 RepID=A0A1F4X3W1_UNCKA|nr:MAG: hypothetical protein A2619_02335 [candidate division WWE3 bacterium RIFOXYD1_FULL_39_9]
MKKIGIIGSRRRNTFADKNLVIKAFQSIYEDGDEIVSGGCSEGGDAFAEYIAKSKQVPITIYYAKWSLLGKSAGHIRNSFIAQDSDILIACVSQDRTGGTEDTIKKFKKLKPKNKIILV